MTVADSDPAAALRGRVALVTGGSGGIGRALCLRLARAGVDVAIGYRGGREAAEHAVAAVEAEGRRAVALGADLADAGAAVELVDRATAALGPIDILVANAGIAPRGTIDDLSAERWHETLAVNVTAPFLQAQRVVPAMRERGWGRLLFVSSVAAFTGGVIGPHYAASKAALLGLTHQLAGRLAPDGITVNAIAPALIEDTAMLPGDPGDLAKLIPLGRLGRPEEVAEVAVAILATGYLTNQAVGIDGGMYPR